MLGIGIGRRNHVKKDQFEIHTAAVALCEQIYTSMLVGPLEVHTQVPLEGCEVRMREHWIACLQERAIALQLRCTLRYN